MSPPTNRRTVLITAGVAAVAAAVWFHWALWIAAAVLLLCNVFYWFRLTMHFGRGDANPGPVVSATPPLDVVP